MKNSIETYIVDSFTDQPFKGNPAGVCILDTELKDEQMALIAKELGLSETTFIKKRGTHYSIRYFSPKMEIPLCGHATLAASKVVFNQFPNQENIHFININHLDLMIQKDEDRIVMEFPIYDTSPSKAPDALLNALGINEHINCEYNDETSILLIEIKSSQILENLNPNLAALYQSHDSINGVLVTAKSNREGYDFESRYFWPWSGTNEDPVTGGTHTFLSKYWNQRLGKTKMNSFQCSARSGFMEIELISDEKFLIKSKAQIILKGDLSI